MATNRPKLLLQQGRIDAYTPQNLTPIHGAMPVPLQPTVTMPQAPQPQALPSGNGFALQSSSPAQPIGTPIPDYTAPVSRDFSSLMQSNQVADALRSDVLDKIQQAKQTGFGRFVEGMNNAQGALTNVIAPLFGMSSPGAAQGVQQAIQTLNEGLKTRVSTQVSQAQQHNNALYNTGMLLNQLDPSSTRNLYNVAKLQLGQDEFNAKLLQKDKQQQTVAQIANDKLALMQQKQALAQAAEAWKQQYQSATMEVDRADLQRKINETDAQIKDIDSRIEHRTAEELIAKDRLRVLEEDIRLGGARLAALTELGRSNIYLGYDRLNQQNRSDTAAIASKLLEAATGTTSQGTFKNALPKEQREGMTTTALSQLKKIAPDPPKALPTPPSINPTIVNQIPLSPDAKISESDWIKRYRAMESKKK